MKKHRLYLDTSVINFLFAEDAPEKMRATVEFFNHQILLNVYDAYVSEIVVRELSRTPDKEARVQAVNLELGYSRTPRMATPLEVSYEEDS